MIWSEQAVGHEFLLTILIQVVLFVPFQSDKHWISMAPWNELIAFSPGPAQFQKFQIIHLFDKAMP